MSDDDSDLGGLAPTTPALPVKKRARSNNTRYEAGPSSKPTKGSRQGAPVVLSGDSEVEAVDPFDFSKATKELPIGRVQPTRNNITTTTNGKADVKGKAKAKITQGREASKARNVSDAVYTNAIELLDGTEIEHHNEPDSRTDVKIAGQSKRANKNVTRSTGGKETEVARLTEKLERAEAHIKDLSQQLEEAFQIRETEAEKLMKEQEAQSERRIRAQEDLIKELTSQLSQKIPLMHSGNATVLDLLTREAADEEKRIIEDEVERWKSMVEGRQRTITQRDQRIAELEKQEQQLRIELKAEIDRSASLAAKVNRGPPSSVRSSGRPGGVDDPRQTQIVRFYEDVTNILVPSMKQLPSQHPDSDDWSLSCVYTFSEEDASNENTAKKSLNFTLKFSYEPEDPESPEPAKSKFVRTVYYTPLELDKEPADFVEKLEFLNGAFSFQRNQLPLFLRTLYQRMNEAVLGDEDDEDSVQELR